MRKIQIGGRSTKQLTSTFQKYQSHKDMKRLRKYHGLEETKEVTAKYIRVAGLDPRTEKEHKWKNW